MKSKSQDSRRYIFHNLDSPKLIQKFSHATVDKTWERVLVPGAVVELNDWEYNYIVNETARGIPPSNQNLDDPRSDAQAVMARIPRFQLQPVL